MRSLSTSLSAISLYALTFLLLFLHLALSKPVLSFPHNTYHGTTLAIRNPGLLDLNPYTPNLSVRNNKPSSHVLSKRVRTSGLPGGWVFITEREYHFNHINSAVRSLVAYYESLIESAAANPNLRAQTLSFPNGPFELIFRVRNQEKLPAAFVPMPLASYMAQMMMRRAQLGLAMKFTGWLEHPSSGVVVDIVLEMAGGILVTILDSAMDMYG
ncbi:MAG: hypothetical protein Q9171_004503 [Xanthocarpia ochracea]